MCSCQKLRGTRVTSFSVTLVRTGLECDTTTDGRMNVRWVDGWSVALCMLWNNCVSAYRPNRKISLCFPPSYWLIGYFFIQRNNKYSFLATEMAKIIYLSYSLCVALSYCDPRTRQATCCTPPSRQEYAFSRCPRAHAIMPRTRITEGGCFVWERDRRTCVVCRGAIFIISIVRES